MQLKNQAAVLKIFMGFQRCSASHFNAIVTHIKTLLLNSQHLSHTKQSHAQATVHGLLPYHLPTLSTLMLTYSSHNNTHSSHLLFHQYYYCQYHHIQEDMSFLYNTLLRSHAKAGCYHQSFFVYNSMARSGVPADSRTFPYALKVCADAREVWKGKEVHGSVVKCGFEVDVFVGNTLIGLYGTCGAAEDAWKMFDGMCFRDVVSWNSIISIFSDNRLVSESMKCFVELVRSGLVVNAVSIVCSLPACVGVEHGKMGRATHAYVLKVGLDSQVTVGNTFIDMYAKCDNPEDSLEFFDGMMEKNDISWNSIIGGFVHVSMFAHALVMFRTMVDEQMKPNSITISSLLPALIELGSFNLGREVHCFSIRSCIECDVFVANSLLDMYAKAGLMKEASEIFNGIVRKNVISWNIMIANYTQNMAEVEAIGLLREMQANGEHPNAVTFTNILPACSRIALLKHGMEIHAKSMRMGCCSDLFVSNALMDMYAKCGRLDLARKIFGMSERDQVSYNTLIVGYSQSSQCLESLHLLVEMSLVGLSYDAISFMGSLSACANMSAIKQGKEIHGLVTRKFFHNHLFVANSLLDLYTKSGQVNIAKRVFDQMLCKDVASWNAMILGYAMQGELDLMFDLFDLMKNENIHYDSVSYIAILSACSHGGLVEKGKKYFYQMVAQNIVPTQMHYACMVDLLGRAGFMKEAMEFIENMPFEADSNVWGALLGASRVHGDLEHGRLAAEHLFILKPGHSGYYTLLSNMYADAGMWDEAIEIRKRMKTKGVKKNPGYSWVEAGDRTHAFVVGELVDEAKVGL